MEYLFYIIIAVALFFFNRHLIRRAYVIGAADAITSYEGVVNIEVKHDKKTNILYYYDLANQLFLFQTSDAKVAVERISKTYANAKLIVFSASEIIHESV